MNCICVKISLAHEGSECVHMCKKSVRVCREGTRLSD